MLNFTDTLKPATPRSRVAQLATTLFVEAMRSEGLRLGNDDDIKRISLRSISAAKSLSESLREAGLLEGPAPTAGPTTGPTAVPEGATNQQEADNRKVAEILSEDAAKVDSAEFGSIRIGARVKHRHNSQEGRVVSRVDTNRWRVDWHFGGSGCVLSSSIQVIPEGETGSIASDRWEVGKQVLFSSSSLSPEEQLGATRVFAQGEEQLTIWGRVDALPRSAATAKRVAQLLNEAEGQRSAAVRRADAIAAARDREASKVAHQATQIRDLEVERDAATTQAEAMEAERDTSRADHKKTLGALKETVAERNEARAALRRVEEELAPCEAAFKGEDMADVPTYVSTALGICRMAVSIRDAAAHREDATAIEQVSTGANADV